MSKEREIGRELTQQEVESIRESATAVRMPVDIAKEMIKEFAKIDEGAAKLMIPYLIWLTFAAYLNIAIALHR